MHLHVRLAPPLPDRGHSRRHRDVGLLVAGRPCRSSRATTCSSVLPGTLSEFELTRRLADSDAAVIMKVGRNLPKIRRALAAAGLLDRAIYVERGTMPETRFDAARRQARRRRALLLDRAGAGMDGPAVSGHARRHRARPRQRRPGDAGGRARRRRRRAGSTATVPISTGWSFGRTRSGSLPTTARSFPAPAPRWKRPPRARRSPSSPAATPASSPWRRRSARRSRPDRRSGATSTSTIVPGVTAMLAVAARVGAPLGHDFCAISLSDNLKPWELIERRLDAASAAGFVIALYNPISQGAPVAARPRLRHACGKNLPGDDAGDLRPRRRPARRAHRGRCRWQRPIRPAPTWRPASSSARPRRASSSAASGRRWSIRRAFRRGRADDRPSPEAPRRLPRPAHPAAPGGGTCRPECRGLRAAAILREGCRAAAVLADDGVDAMLLEQRELVGFGERPARQDVGRVGHGERRLDRVDAADQIGVLRRGLEGGDLLPAQRQEDPPRLLAQALRRLRRVVDRDPAVARASPARAGAEAPGSARRPPRPRRPRWRRFARHRDASRRSAGRFAGSRDRRPSPAAPPKPPILHGYRLRRRVFGPAGQRQGDVEILARAQAGRPVAGLPSSRRGSGFFWACLCCAAAEECPSPLPSPRQDGERGHRR